MVTPELFWLQHENKPMFGRHGIQLHRTWNVRKLCPLNFSLGYVFNSLKLLPFWASTFCREKSLQKLKMYREAVGCYNRINKMCSGLTPIRSNSVITSKLPGRHKDHLLSQCRNPPNYLRLSQVHGIFMQTNEKLTKYYETISINNTSCCSTLLRKMLIHASSM